MASPEAPTQTLTPYQETGRVIFRAMGLQQEPQKDPLDVLMATDNGMGENID